MHPFTSKDAFAMNHHQGRRFVPRAGTSAVGLAMKFTPAAA
jgi:hypothetical protein